MTGTLAVSAQWALHGKVADAQGYKVVACSTGELDRANFTDAIGRFALGALDTLPQASVSYLQPATRPGGSYLAVAVHWFAVPGQRYADGVLPLDDFGRQTAFTSYFCVPYQQLAESGVSYLELYQAFSAVTLPASDGPPAQVAVSAAGAAIPAIGELALRAAALLLTGTPVCVLGAEQTAMRERLAFIDTVMALLPYGFRARMTAATWTKATNRDHKFRLFFSSAPRSARPTDHVLVWDQPERAPLPSGHALDYIDTLDDKLSPVARLRELTTELGFGPKAATQALELLDGTRPGRPRRQAPAPAGPAMTAATARPGGAGPGGAGPTEPDPNEKVLRDCADAIRAGNAAALRSSVRWLENQARTAALDETRRAAYRRLITRLGLLAPHPELRKQEGELYAALLAVAFRRPLSYQGYCQAEKCLQAEPGSLLHPALLNAMDRSGLADPVVTALVLDQLDTARLNQWLRSGRVDAAGLVGLLAEQWPHDSHAQTFCDVVLVYLRTCPDRYHTGELRGTLREHGFLARPLARRHPDNEQYQFYALHQLLLAAYPDGLDRAAIGDVLAGPAGPPPTAALFAAVLKLLTAPGDWELACQAYSYGSATLLGVDRVSAAQLRERVPGLRRTAPLAQ